MVITQEAVKYIREEGSIITLDFNGIGCCVPIYVAVVEIGAPEEPQNFQRVESDGITVYYPSTAKISEDGLYLVLVNAGDNPRLEVTGLHHENDF